MIQATYTTDEGRVIADTLPSVGQFIKIEGWGLCKVLGLSHNARDNYIQLQDRKGEFTCPFAVKETGHEYQGEGLRFDEDYRTP